MTKAKRNETTEVTAVKAQAVQVAYVEEKDMAREAQLASEINLITEQTKQMVLMNFIELGKRLTEAKAMVKHGEWGNWLKERVNYSQRTANNMMKLYAEYGASGIASKSQSIANLSVTQAVALLEIPAEEREKFAEQNNAKDMTIRELKEELAKKKAELAEEQSSTKAALAEAQKRHEQENARYKEQAEKALADKSRIERELEQQKKRQAELIESKDTEAKAQVEAAIKQSREELARINEEVDALQEELAKMNSKHKAELEAIREEERKNFQEELNAKDKEIEESAKRFSKAVEEHRKEMASTRKDLLKEQSKNSEVATLGKATYAMEQLLKSYEQVMGIIESVGKFDRVTAKKMMTEVNKSMHAVETKVRKKLTA